MPEYEVGSLYALIGVDNKPFLAGMAQTQAAMDATAKKMSAAAARTQAATDASMRKTSAAMDRVGKRTASLGKSLTKYVTLPLVVAGAASAKFAVDFERDMERIRTQAGASQAEVDKMSKAILKLASSGKVSQGPDELAKGLYHVESVGLRGAKALDLLRVAAEGAAVGGSNLEDTVSALAGVVITAIPGTQNYARTMATLNATVGAGNMSMQDLVDALKSGIAPVAKTAGVSLQSLTSALAMMTDEGVPAGTAANRLRTALFMMTNPTQKAEKVLKSIGLTSTSLGHDLRKPDGVMVAMQDLRHHLEQIQDPTKKLAALGSMFGGSRSAGTIAMLLNNLSRLGIKYDQIGKTAGRFNKDVAATQETASFRLQAAWARIQVSMVKIGAALLPTVTSLANMAARLATAFSSLPGPLRTAAAAAAAFGVALGPVLFIAGNLTRAAALVTGRVGLMEMAMGSAAPRAAGLGVAAETATTVGLAPLGVAAAGIAGLGLAYWFMGSHVAADKFATSVAGLKSGIAKLPGDLHALAGNAQAAASAFQRMNEIVKKTPNHLKAIAAAQDKYEHSLEHGVAIRQRYAHDLEQMKGGISKLIKAGQPYAGLQVQGAMATAHMSARVADWQANLKTALGSLDGFIGRMQASHPALAATARQSQAAAAAALLLSERIKAIPSFKQVRVQMITDIITNRYTGASSGPPTGTGGNPHRAAGGPVTGGKAYTVGERGPETFVPNTSGSILPAGVRVGAALVHAMAKGGKGAAPAGTAEFDRIVRNILARMRAAIGRYGPRIVQEFKNLAQQITDAFDRQTQKMQAVLDRQLNGMTKAGKELQALQDAHDEAGRQQAISDARSALSLATAQGDPAAILQAQQQLDDALYQEQVASLEKLDQAEQKARAKKVAGEKAALAKRRAELRRHIEKVLKQLKDAEARMAAIQKARRDLAAAKKTSGTADDKKAQAELKRALGLDPKGSHNIRALEKLLRELTGAGHPKKKAGGGGKGSAGHVTIERGAVQVNAKVIKNDREFEDMVANALIRMSRRSPQILGGLVT